MRADFLRLTGLRTIGIGFAIWPGMTDTTATISPIANSAPTTDDRIVTLTTMVEKLTSGLNAFSGAVVSTLSGQQHTAPAPAATAVKRRGRPPKAVAPEPVKAKPATPDETHAVDLVRRAGRITQTELADLLKVERSLIQHRMSGPLERGEVFARYVKRPGEHRNIVFYRPDWISVKGE